MLQLLFAAVFLFVGVSTSQASNHAGGEVLVDPATFAEHQLDAHAHSKHVAAASHDVNAKSGCHGDDHEQGKNSSQGGCCGVSCFVGTTLDYHSVGHVRTTGAYADQYAALLLAVDVIRLDRPPKN